MNIIDFNERKRQKEAATLKNEQSKLLWQFQQSRKTAYIHKLVDTKVLDYEEHQLLLAFMVAMESHDVKFIVIFADALKMTRVQFHEKYAFDWWTSVQCALTFLAIQKKTNCHAYERYIELMSRQ